MVVPVQEKKKKKESTKRGTQCQTAGERGGKDAKRENRKEKTNGQNMK